jgi:hypothetical protein
MVSVGVTVKGSLVMMSTTFIQLYLPTGAVMAMFIPSNLSHFSAAASVPKGKQNFSS